MNLNIGFAEVNITPSKKVSLKGQFAERISQYIEKPLTATTLAIESDNEQMVLVSCDLPLISWKLVCDIREVLSGNKVGLDPEKIIISAIHTHTSYGFGVSRKLDMNYQASWRTELDKFLKPGQKYVEKEKTSDNDDIATEDENYNLLMQKLPEVILNAWNNKKPGSFSNAFGRAPVGMCRRTLYNDNTAKMWGDTNKAVFEALEGGNDSGVELLYIFDDANKLSGVVVNLACPAQCVQHRHFISPDFWGEVKVRLRNYFGNNIYMLPLCSAAGDQCPVDLIRWVNPETDINDPNCERNNPPKRKADPSMFDISGMVKVGKRISNEVIEVWNDGLDEPVNDIPFLHRVVTAPLPLRRATITDVENARKGIKEYLDNITGNIDYNDVAKLQIHLGVLKRYKLQEKVDVLDVEIHIVRLGNIAIVTNPFELFLDYGNQIKARSDAEQTFIIQLANGAEGYLPTKKAEIHGHYSAFISSGYVGHSGGEQLVRITIQNVKELFKASK